MKKFKHKNIKHIISNEFKEYIYKIEKIEYILFIKRFDYLILKNVLDARVKLVNDVIEAELSLIIDLNKNKILKNDDIKINYLNFENKLISDNKTLFVLFKRKLDKNELSEAVISKFNKIRKKN